MVSLSEYPKLREDLIVRQVDEDFVVYDPVSDRTALVNLSAGMILDLCDGTRTVDAIAAEVSQAYSVEEILVMRDVCEVLGKLSKEGFLEQ